MTILLTKILAQVVFTLLYIYIYMMYSVTFCFIKGAVKLTPAHDIFDYELATKHNLPIISVIDEFGKISCEHDEFNVSYEQNYNNVNNQLNNSKINKLLSVSNGQFNGGIITACKILI